MKPIKQDNREINLVDMEVMALMLLVEFENHLDFLVLVVVSYSFISPLN